MVSRDERIAIDQAFKDDFPGSPEARKHLLLAWKDRAFYAATAHYLASERYELRNKILTLVNMSSAITVLFVANHRLFASYNSLIEEIILATASLLTVLLSASQYLLKYDERANQHKLAANDFSTLKRKIERYLTIDDLSNSLLHNLNRHYDFIGRTYPLVSHYMWRKALGWRVRTLSDSDPFEGPSELSNLIDKHRSESKASK